MSGRSRGLVAAFIVLTLGLSVSRWWMEGRTLKVWRDNEPRITMEYCPDGLDTQIQALADVMLGKEQAAERYLSFIRESHQSSTQLVEVLAAPLVLLGIAPAPAFVCISALASLALVLLFLGLLREVLPDSPTSRIAMLLVFLVHPATVRCFARPQTDALLAFFTLAVLVLARRAAHPDAGRAARLALTAVLCAAVFIKIHALLLLVLAPAIAFVGGARGRRLALLVLYGLVLPLLWWVGVFWWLDLFGTIGHAWAMKGTHYQEITGLNMLWVGSLTLLPLLVLALRKPAPLRSLRGLPVVLWLTVAGHAAVLVLGGIPPKVRFQYPMIAALVLLGALAGQARGAGGKQVPAWAGYCVAWFGLQSLGIVGIDLYMRYIGPSRDWEPLNRILIHLM